MSDHAQVDLLITNTAEVLTCAADAIDLIGRIPQGEVAIGGDQIVAIGEGLGLASRQTVDAKGGVVMPGFVDAHTHVVFGGWRLDEYAAAVGGVDPPEGAPVGILGTVASTRESGLRELVSQSSERIGDMIRSGTTTIESKSGYGLEPETELRILEANAELDENPDVDIVSTYLGAHAFPPDIDRHRYVDQVIDLIPEVAERRLAEFCDVYCDEGYFDIVQTRRILEAGLNHGLRPKIHLDAYSNTGAATLAADLAAVSVDHLNLTSPADIEILAAADVTGVYMPCLDLAVDHPKPFNARAAIDAGMELALATDICPGCWVTNMQLAIALACRHGGMTVAHAIRAATYGAARAVGRADRIGSLVPGMQADVVILDATTYQEIAYRIGRDSISTVIKNGRVVVDMSS